MGIFGTSADAAIVEEVELATTEKNAEEDWGVIMNICDKAGKSPDSAKGYLRAILKRLANSDPHIGVKAVTLLDACIKNSGKIFHIEVASREFENEFQRLMQKAHPTVQKKLRESLKKWESNEFKDDPQLSLIPTLYMKLKNQGYDFSSSETPVKKAAPVSKDPNVVETQEEEEQILKAIELSLKETSESPRNQASTSLYPSVNMAAASAAAAAPAKEQRKVRALYDFEAAEDNELTFNSGEIIIVIDDSDPNWWKGSNHRGQGLFPANFVTADLSVEPEKFLYEKAKKMVQFKENAEVKVVEKEEPEEIEINEQKIDRLLHLLHEADPTNPETDSQELLSLEREANGMGPLIDSELERVDRKHAQLTQLSTDLVEALGLYHMLMREPQIQPPPGGAKGFAAPQSPMGVAYPPGHPGAMSMPPMGMPGPDRPHFMPGYQPVMGHAGVYGVNERGMGPAQAQSVGMAMGPPPGMRSFPVQGMPFHPPQTIIPPTYPGAIPPPSQTSLQNGQGAQQAPPHFSPSTHMLR